MAGEVSLANGSALRNIAIGLVASLLGMAAPASPWAQENAPPALAALMSATDAPGPRDDHWRARVLTTFRSGWTSPATLTDVQRSDDVGLRAWYDATISVNFHAAAAAIDDQAIVLRELARRGLATDRDFLDHYRGLVHARRFEEAAALQRAHPVDGMEQLPALTGLEAGVDGVPTVMRVDPESGRLQRRAVDLARGTQIVAIVHPGCGFSQRALEAISGDAELSALFEGRSHFVAPPSGRIEFDRFRDWNRAHPGAEIALAYHVDEWPITAMSSTPVFHFFLDGKLVESVSSWPKEGNRAALLAASRRAGLGPETNSEDR